VLFLLGVENYTLDRRRAAVEAYAGVISNSLWHFEPQAPTDYLNLIVAQQDYESFQVFTEDGLPFVDVQNKSYSAFTNLLIALKLIKRVEISAPIHYNGEMIGEIRAIWLNKNIYSAFYAFVVLILSFGVIGLYSRILQSNRALELGVQERTAELHHANIGLRESEARYRSIFEDSPISLREEDFSEVKKIVDRLRIEGVEDFQAYFDQHPQTVAECVRLVRVLNINQKTLELFKTEDKERLYAGLSGIFTEKSMASFGEQLAAFASGETHFDCETIQQTVDGEQLWAGTRVSIAPGYEDSWGKVFISIVDITDRKEAEAELADYHQHLEELVAARTRDLAVLYDVTAVASNVLDLDELLARLLGQSLLAIRRNAGIIHLLDESGFKLQLRTAQGVPCEISNEMIAMFARQGEARELLERHAAVIIPDLEKDARIPQVVRECGWRTYVGVPIQDTRGQLAGVLNIFGETHEQLTVEELTLLAAIADHIGLAVENVHLRQQAEQTAVQEDRQRLARELHDAVSQNLFSASVIAETLPRLWQRDPGMAQPYLGDLYRLIKGALAEMRMLLLELRPMSMENAVLEDLLQQLMDGIQGRTQLKVSLQIHGQGNFPSQVKENLFRIAQEALNNVVKHSRAQQVALVLDQSEAQVTLCISDDGQGFADERVDGGHLGLQIMHERAEHINADLSITSRPGQGTQIRVTWPGAGDENQP
jgi:signal transduction histidine kinase